MAKSYVLAPDWKLRCEKICKFSFSNLNLNRVIFLKEIESKPGDKFALTKKVDPIYKVLHPDIDYIMIFFENTIVASNLGEAQKNILCEHELKHLEPDGEKVVKHDVEEFSSIIRKYGHDWVTNPDVRNPLDGVEVKIK